MAILWCWGKAHLAGPAAAIFGLVKERPSQNLKKFGWAIIGSAKVKKNLGMRRDIFIQNKI